MKLLLAVVCASACVGPMPVQGPPVVEYPRGKFEIGQSGRCALARIQRAIDYSLTCSFTPIDHR